MNGWRQGDEIDLTNELHAVDFENANPLAGLGLARRASLLGVVAQAGQACPIRLQRFDSRKCLLERSALPEQSPAR